MSIRNLLFSGLFQATRALRPSTHRALRPLAAGDTVLYAQFEKALGCCVHGTPLIEALHAAQADLRIVVATRGPGAATLRHHPGVTDVIETESDPTGSAQTLWKTAAELRGRLTRAGTRPDFILQDASSRRGTWALLPALLRLAPTIGFADAPALYDRHLGYDRSLSLIDNNLRLVAAMGGSGQHFEPAIYFNSQELAAARALLAALPAGCKGRVGFVLQGSGGQQTRWADAKSAEVIRWVEAQGYATVFLGTAADREGIDRVRTMAGSSNPSLAGQTSLPELAAVLCLCDLLISVDTGTMHMGRAVGVPMVVLGPSWQRPIEWLPLGLPNVRILRGQDRNDVPPGYQLDEIAVADVSAAAGELLSHSPPKDEAREARVARRLSDIRS